jgi:hypothetical protein
MPAEQAARVHGVSAATARKWLGRYLAGGAQGLLDKSSRPARSPRSIDPSVALTIVKLRRKLFLQARIATYMGVSKATVSRVLRRAGLSKLSDLQPPEPVQHYERETPGELLHIDIKTLGRFEDVGHRITGDRSKRTRHLGWEFLLVAVDDDSRIAYTQITLTNARKASRRSCCRQRATSPDCASRSSASSPTTAQRSVQPRSAPRAWSWASNRSSPAPSGHRPTARQNDHPVSLARVRERPRVPAVRSATGSAAVLEPLLQLAPRAPWHRVPGAYVLYLDVPQERLDTSHLAPIP